MRDMSEIYEIYLIQQREQRERTKHRDRQRVDREQAMNSNEKN